MTALDCVRGSLVDSACLAGARVRLLRDERGGWSCSLRRRNEPMVLRAGSTPQQAMDYVEAELAREARQAGTKEAPSLPGASMAAD